nr:MAG TPA: protein of unknown function (DUF883) [Caudoviricetes sp.]
MVRSKESRQLELLKALNKKFPEITLDKDDLDGVNRRRLVDLLIANKDVDTLLNTLETLGLDSGVINAGILDNIHKVSNDTLYEIKGLYFRTRSKVRPEVFMATFAGFLTDGANIDQLTSVMQKTLETEGLSEERVAARAAEKENERKEQMENNEQIQEQPTIVIDLNDPIGKRSINDLMDEWTEELRAERDAGEELKEGVEEELNSFKDTVNDLKEETLKKTQETFNALKETREKKEEEKAKEENSSIWMKLAIGATVGAVVGVGVWAYKKYFEE